MTASGFFLVGWVERSETHRQQDGGFRCALPTLRIQEAPMLTGSCLCGSVAYEVNATPGPIVHCHCATCRKTHGSAFSTLTNVPRDRFRWSKGESLLRGFESSPGKTRYFCTQCGSHIVAERSGTGTMLLRLGCLD